MGRPFNRPSFAAGEVSKKTAARVDQEKIHTGLKTCRNFRVLREGGVENRAGLRFLGLARDQDPDHNVRLVEFKGSGETPYTLEFGEYYVRMWKDRALLLDPAGGGAEIVDASVSGSLQYELNTVSPNFSPVTRDAQYATDSPSPGDPALGEPQNVTLDGVFMTYRKLPSVESMVQGSGGVDVSGTLASVQWLPSTWSLGGRQYATADPVAGDLQLSRPLAVAVDGVLMTYVSFPQPTLPNELETLMPPSSWAWGDFDALGYDTVYICLPAQGFVAAELIELRYADIDVHLGEGMWTWGDYDDLGYETLYLRIPGSGAVTTEVIELRYIVERTTPYSSDDIPLVDYVASADVLYLTHGSHPPASLSRFGDTDWSYAELGFGGGVDVPEKFYLVAKDPAYSAPAVSVEYALVATNSDGIKSRAARVGYSANQAPSPSHNPGNVLEWDMNDVVPAIQVLNTDVPVEGDFDRGLFVIMPGQFQWVHYSQYLDGLPGADQYGRAMFFAARLGSGTYDYVTTPALPPDLGFSLFGLGLPFSVYKATDLGGGLVRPNAEIYRSTRGRSNGNHYVFQPTLWEFFYGQEKDGGSFYSLFGFSTLWIRTPTAVGIPLDDPALYPWVIKFDRGIKYYELFRREGYNPPMETPAQPTSVGGSFGPWGRLSVIEPFGGVLVDPNYVALPTANINTHYRYWDAGNIIPDQSKQPPSDDPLFSKPSQYPVSCAFFSQRLVFGGTGEFVYRLHLSASGDYADFQSEGAVADDAPIVRDLTTAQPIRYMVDVGSLIVFTGDGEWRVWGEGGPVATSTINAIQFGETGIARVKPLKAEGFVCYAQQLGRGVNVVRFDLQADGYVPESISTFSEHILEDSPVVDWAFAHTPNRTLYGLKGDGSMFGVTYEPSQQMNAWHRHDTLHGFLESVATARSVSFDDVYFSVKRDQVSGDPVRCIEVLDERNTSNRAQLFFVDSGLSYSSPQRAVTNIATFGMNLQVAIPGAALPVGADLVCGGLAVGEVEDGFWNGLRCRVTLVLGPGIYVLGEEFSGQDIVPPGDWSASETAWVRELVSSVSGLDHLEGRAVSVLGDGFVQDGSVVSAGAVDIEPPSADVVVGLPITSTIETLDFDGGAGSDSLVGAAKSVDDITLTLFESAGGAVGVDAADLIDPRYEGAPGMGSAPELFTGKLSVTPPQEWNDHGRVLVEQRLPLPITILAITPNFSVSAEED